jgi:hypothetical protein
MELKDKKIQANTMTVQSIGTAIFRVILNLSLLLILKLYFLIPDMINKARKYAFKKKMETGNLRFNRNEEAIPQLSELKNSL